MGFGNMGAGGIAELLGQLVNGVAQHQGSSPQDVLAQHGVTEADIQPGNLNQQSILQSLMGFVQQNPQIVMLVASQIPALRGLLGGGASNAAGGGGLAGMLGGLLGGGQPAQPGQQGGDMLGGLGGLLGGLMGGAQPAPNAAEEDASAVPSSAPPTGDAMNQLLGALLSAQRQ